MARIEFIGFRGDFSHEESKILAFIKHYLGHPKNQFFSSLAVHSRHLERYDLDNFQIRLLLSSENVQKVDYQAIRLITRLARTTRLPPSLNAPFLYLEEALHYLPMSLRKILHKQPFHRLGSSYFDYIEDIENKSNCYAIIPNRSDSDRIFSLPYFLHGWLDDYQPFLHRPQNSQQNFCAFVVSDAHNRERIYFCKALSKYKKVDSYGKVLKNTEIPSYLLHKYQQYHRRHQHQIKHSILSMQHVNRMNQELFKPYKFVICFENSCAEDYITEKIVNVFLAGSIPIYKGAPNIHEFFNPKAFLNFDDYGSRQALIDKVIELDSNPQQYMQMLSQPIFKNNILPARINNLKSQLCAFLDRVIGSASNQDQYG